MGGADRKGFHGQSRAGLGLRALGKTRTGVSAPYEHEALPPLRGWSLVAYAPMSAPPFCWLLDVASLR